MFFFTVYCQSSFSTGFTVGYKKGYCYDKVGCSPSLPPLPPLPNPGEDPDSYLDGYNRGFKMGLKAGEENSSQGKSNTTSADTPIDYMYKPTQLEMKIASKAPQNFVTLINKAQEFFNQGKYSDCINICGMISSITHLVSYQYYNLLSMSYDKLGDERQSKKYEKKARRYLKKYY